MLSCVPQVLSVARKELMMLQPDVLEKDTLLRSMKPTPRRVEESAVVSEYDGFTVGRIKEF